MSEQHSEMRKLWSAIKQWQEKQFGSAESRGPLGPLRHLQKEAREAENSAIALHELGQEISPMRAYDDAREGLRTEIADCLFMVIESAWRSGMTLDDLMLLCWKKLAENKDRQWPAPTADKPVEHVREEQR